jgi:hypothetical protein
MSKNIILVIIYHRHKRLDLIYTMITFNKINNFSDEPLLSFSVCLFGPFVAYETIQNGAWLFINKREDCKMYMGVWW